MNDVELVDAVARKTGEDCHEIRRRGFSLADDVLSRPDEDPDCLFDMVDLPETGTVDWDKVLCGFREPFLSSTLKARRKRRRVSSTVTNPSRPQKIALRAA